MLFRSQEKGFKEVAKEKFEDIKEKVEDVEELAEEKIKDVNGNVINKVDNIDDEIEDLEKKHAKPRTTLDSIVSLFATKEDK